MSEHIFIKATSQSEGDLHLSGATWAVSKALIKCIRIATSSTDWDLYLLQNDNGYAADDANIPKLQIMEAGNGNAAIYLDLPYEDEDNSDEVHLYYLDNSGANTADIYIIGGSLEIAETILSDIKRLLGLMQENHYMDMTAYDDDDNMTSCRIRIYNVAGSVGTNNDVLATYTVTATYTDKLLDTFKVVKT